MKKFRCKQNIFDFKADKFYEREETETGNAYRFIDEKGIGHVFFKTDGNMKNIFEEVEIQEDNTYNFSDLLNEPVETQFEVKYKSGSTDASYIVIKKYNDDRGKYLQWDSGDEEYDDEVTIDEKISNATFTKVEKSLVSMSFDEAISEDDVLYRVEHEHMDSWLNYQALQKSKEYLEFNQLMELLSEIPADELKVVLLYGRWYTKGIGKSC